MEIIVVNRNFNVFLDIVKKKSKAITVIPAVEDQIFNTVFSIIKVPQYVGSNFVESGDFNRMRLAAATATALVESLILQHSEANSEMESNGLTTCT